MSIGRSIFGGYKRREVDRRMSQLTESEKNAREMVDVLEKELADLRSSTRRDSELVNQELETERRHVRDLTDQITAVVGVVNSLQTQLDGRDRQIGEMEARCRRADDSAAEVDARLRQLGEVYEQALTYAEKIREDARKEAAQMIDVYLSELNHSGRKMKERLEEIENYRGALGDIAEGLEETSTFLRGKLDRLGNVVKNRPTSPFHEEFAKNRIIEKVRSEFHANGYRGNRHPASATDSGSAGTTFQEPAAKPSAMDPVSNGIAAYPKPTTRPSEMDAADVATSAMRGTAEDGPRAVEEDREKYMKTFESMERGRYDKTSESMDRGRYDVDAPTKGPTDRPVIPQRPEQGNPAFHEDDGPVIVPRKTSIKEILDKYAKQQ
jgi:hypothetical protein